MLTLTEHLGIYLRTVSRSNEAELDMNTVTFNSLASEVCVRRLSDTLYHEMHDMHLTTLDDENVLNGKNERDAKNVCKMHIHLNEREGSKVRIFK